MVAVAQAQTVKDVTQITEQESLQLTRNLMRIAIFNISYVRGLFEEQHFEDKFVPALEMKIKKLMPTDPLAKVLIDWMEKGVYEALKTKYLKTLVFGLCSSQDGPMLEEYFFNFSYGDGANSDEVSMSVTRAGESKGKAIKTAEIGHSQMKANACKLVRQLIALMRTLNPVPEERCLLMKLFYYDHCPEDWEPPFFRAATPDDNLSFEKAPLRIKVGEVDSKHYAISLKVKSVLDPCNNAPRDSEVSQGAATDQSDSDDDDDDEDEEMEDAVDAERQVAESRPALLRQSSMGERLQTIGEDCDPADGNEGESDATQDPEREEVVYGPIKTWLQERTRPTIEFNDILAEFSDVSVRLAAELVNRLIEEKVLTALTPDVYQINGKGFEGVDLDAHEDPDSFAAKKKLEDGEGDGEKKAELSEEEELYMKALKFVLHTDYVTIGQLQNHLAPEVGSTTVRKLLDRMGSEGYIEDVASNRRLGRKVLRSDKVEQKVTDTISALRGFSLGANPSEKTATGYRGSNVTAKPPAENFPAAPKAHADGSTCGGVFSVGSEITRHSGDVSVFKKPLLKEPDSPLLKGMEISDATVGTNRRATSLTASTGNTRMKTIQESQETDFGCSQRYRKASVVERPIQQSAKRFRTEP